MLIKNVQLLDQFGSVLELVSAGGPVFPRELLVLIGEVLCPKSTFGYEDSQHQFNR